MPTKPPCLVCGGHGEPGEPVTGGFVCEGCWLVHLRTATSQLCERIMEGIDREYRLDPVTVSRIVASALPDRADRLRVWFELSIRGLGRSRASGKRSPHLIALADELRNSGLPQKLIGQRHFPGSVGSRGFGRVAHSSPVVEPIPLTWLGEFHRSLCCQGFRCKLRLRKTRAEDQALRPDKHTPLDAFRHYRRPDSRRR
jgi:hypothetical protein